MNRILYILLFMLLTACVGSHNSPNLPAIGVTLNELGNIPKREYSTYTTYFFAREIDLTKGEIDKQNYLKESFDAFSKSIGENNLAIWFGSIDPSNVKFDIARSKDLCDKYGVSYSGGPYVLITKENPVDSSKLSNAVLLDFSSVNPERIKYVMDSLEQKIRTERYEEINNIENYKQIVLSKFDDNKGFIQEVVKSILGRY